MYNYSSVVKHYILKYNSYLSCVEGIIPILHYLISKIFSVPDALDFTCPLHSHCFCDFLDTTFSAFLKLYTLSCFGEMTFTSHQLSSQIVHSNSSLLNKVSCLMRKSIYVYRLERKHTMIHDTPVITTHDTHTDCH